MFESTHIKKVTFMPYLLLCLGSFLFFISILVLLMPSLSHFEVMTVAWVSQHRTEYLNTLSLTLSAIGGMPCVLFLTILWCLYQVWYKQYTRAIFIGFGVVGSMATAWLLKFLFSRPRPAEMYHLVESYGASFPSAHAVYAAVLGTLALYLSLHHKKRQLIWVCAFFWLFSMGISRIYLGVHFPSDVLAGWSIGFIWITLLYLLYTKFSHTKHINF